MKNDKEMTPYQAIVLNVIRAIQAEKRIARRYPDHVLLIGDKPNEQLALAPIEFRTVVDELKEIGAIHIGPTSQDEYVREV